MQLLHVPTSRSFDGLEMGHCPSCGADVTGNAVDPCSHLLFTYADEVGEFEHVAPSIRGAVDAALAHRGRLEGTDEDAAAELHLPGDVAGRYGSESAVCFAFGANATGGGYSVGIEFEPRDA